jgi:hypothetical protein
MKATSQIDGWFDFETLYDELVSKIPQNGIFVECGAWLGKSSSYLCDIVSAKRPDVTVYIVDSWKGSENEINSTHQLATQQDIYQMFLENMGDRKFTPVRALSKDAAQQFENNSLDVIFIDMCHAYECVKEDIELWYPKLKNNGMMAGHDYFSWPGVPQAVNEKFKTIQTMSGCWLVHNNQGVYNG